MSESNSAAVDRARRMPNVQTVLGPVPVHSLGVTLAHEHLRTRHEGVTLQFPHLYDEAAAEDRIVTLLLKCKAVGLCSYCDATVMGLGRDVGLMIRVAQRTGINIIAATGAYTFDALPPYFAGRGVEELADAFVRDLTVGIQGTSARAGFIKCATDAPGLTDGVVKVLRAAGQASAATGSPIMTHSVPALRNGLDQLSILVSEGVPPGSIVIGHSGDSSDIDYLSELAEQGAVLGMDRFGMDDLISAADRETTIVELVARGFGKQIVLSHDHSIVRDLLFARNVTASRLNWITTYVLESVIPSLEGRGLAPDQVEAMVVSNVHRWLQPYSG
jgi:phosphotriesterase-related protein